MLAGSFTPRPRPPAKSRRASSQVKSSPPPPYRPSLPDDPLTPRDHERLSVESLRGDWPRFPFSAQPDQWNDRSREELSDLLHKADEIIKDRELELDVTSAVCKSLYENNLELKSRHQALLARLPSSPASSSSPAGSLGPSPMSPDSQLPQSPHYYSADDSRASSNASMLIPRPRPHYRRVSVSPADLALLSDQNAELLAKLEKLETESIQADQSGRRKLRNLEKEIQGLREELDRTRARSDELEKKARVVSESAASRDEDAERKRREREERLRALRTKTEKVDQETEVRDFAPGGPLSGYKNRFTPRRRHISEAVARLNHDEDVFEERPRRVSLQTGLSRSVSLSHQFRFPAPIEAPVTLTHEYALVSQLLLKIQELEETNSQITQQQAHTVAQLQTVQKDATSLRLAYESLGNGEDVEWIAEESEGSPSTGDDEANETIRFASLRRTLSADASVDFVGGIDVNMRSSLRHPVLPDLVPIVAHPKVRRSVVGLFDSPQEGAVSPSSPVSETAASVLDMMIPGLPPVPFVPQPSNTSSASTSRSPSPVSSTNLAGTESSIEDDVHYPTLDSELGAAFDGSWESRSGQDSIPGSQHFRTSSIASLTSIISGGESTGSSASISGPHTWREPERSNESFTSTTSFYRGNSALQPGFWQGTRQHRSVSSEPSEPDSQQTTPAERKRRKSQTIRMRAAHWKEGRFGGTLIPADKHDSIDKSRPSTPVPERLANAFEAIVDTMNRSKADLTLSLDLGDDEGLSAQSTAVGRRSRSEVAGRPAPRQRGIVSFVLEIWLWLQFVIIVIVFVWAMARRGPKSVLEEAGRRKTG